MAEALEELPLGHRVAVEGVHDALVLHVPYERLLEHRVVVSVAQGGDAGEEVEEGAAFLVVDIAAGRPVEDRGPGPAVGPDL